MTEIVLKAAPPIEEFKLTLPFPPSELNPNARLNKFAKAAVTKKYRKQCAARAQVIPSAFVAMLAQDKKPRIIFDIAFVQASDSWDFDNMIAALKAAFDGISDAIGINDKFFRPGAFEYPAPDAKNPRIEIKIKKGIDHVINSL